jgi:hypothetical protein
MADNKVTIDPPKDGKLNINVSVTSKADKSSAAIPAIQSVENLNVKSIQNLNAEEKKASEEKKNTKTPAKSNSSAQLLAIAKTLDDIKNTLVTISASQSTKSSSKKSAKPEDSVDGMTHALIQSYADKNFERGIREAFNKVEFSKDFHDKFAASIKSALADASYVVQDSEKTDSAKTETVASPTTGEEVSHSEYSINSAFTEEHAAALMQLRDAAANPNRNDTRTSRCNAVKIRKCCV